MRRRHGLNFYGIRRSIHRNLIALMALRITLPLVGKASALSRADFTLLCRWHRITSVDTLSPMADAGHLCYPPPVSSQSNSYINAVPYEGLLSTPPLRKLGDALRDGQSIPQMRDPRNRRIEPGG